ncbi:hypothetical protein NQ318_002562 [Aromia moschata]|uniref:Uncharacterized protein n=1 Tax=Aromia moschata TaxID=1265417 RepID=A0AAV8X4B4_9CUCU|nr:hypothetical protein NQ318_002562 [Aromia moschata]
MVRRGAGNSIDKQHVVFYEHGNTERENTGTFYVNCIIEFFIGCRTGDNAFDKDITRTREFGCRWFGGSASRLSCNCEAEAEMFIEEGSIPTYSTTEIEISECKTVRFGRNSIRELTTLRRVHLSEINSIVFDEESVIWYGYREAGNQQRGALRPDHTVP